MGKVVLWGNLPLNITVVLYTVYYVTYFVVSVLKEPLADLCLVQPGTERRVMELFANKCVQI